MGEVGCLKDGHFQNLQVENTTILDTGDTTMTGLLTVAGGLTHKTVVSVDGAQTDLSSSRIVTAAATHDINFLAETDARDKVIIVAHAMADAQFIQLPEATTSNGGKHVRVILGIAVADAFAVGFVTTNIIGSATAMGDTDEANAPTDVATAFADVGDGFKSVRFVLDTAAAAGGTGGTVLDFYYTGTANVVVYRGNLVSEIDDPTLTNHFKTTVVTTVFDG
jgi:hypothetical protein